MTVAPGICKRCRHTERYVGKLDSYGICGNCAGDLWADKIAEREADLDAAYVIQRAFDAQEKANAARDKAEGRS